MVRDDSFAEKPIELLWCCYASTLVMGVSILADWRPGLSAAVVFHLGVGLLAYSIDVAAGGTTGSRTVTAALAHVAAPLIGVRQVLRSGWRDRMPSEAAERANLLAGDSKPSRRAEQSSAAVRASRPRPEWQGLTPHAWLGAVGLLALTTALALFTDPALNINLAHTPWEPVAPYFQHMWLYRLANLIAAAGFCFAADRGLRAVTARLSQRAAHVREKVTT